MRWEASGKAAILLKTLQADCWLRGKLLGVWWKYSGFGGARDVQGETELYDFKVRAGRTASLFLW